MPSKTARQARAMGAAAGGSSKLGIPQSVGRDFVKADAKTKGKKKKGKRPVLTGHRY